MPSGRSRKRERGVVAQRVDSHLQKEETTTLLWRSAHQWGESGLFMGKPTFISTQRELTRRPFGWHPRVLREGRARSTRNLLAGSQAKPPCLSQERTGINPPAGPRAEGPPPCAQSTEAFS